MRKFFIYGFGGPEDRYKCLSYYRLTEEQITVGYIKYLSNRMRENNPSIMETYLMDSRYGLFNDFREAVQHDSVEENVCFRAMIMDEGLRIE